MKYIYFDQFAISGLSCNKNDNWNKILSLLFQLKKQNKISCCTSAETIFETSQRNNTGIDENYKLISGLLDNCFFNDINHIICQQIAKNIKGISTEQFIYPKFNFTSKDLNDQLNLALNLTFGDIEIPTFPIEITRTNIAIMIKVLSEKAQYDFINSINTFLFSKQSIPSLYYSILQSLKSDFNFEFKDFVNLKEDIYNNGFKVSPTLKIFKALYPFIFFSEQSIIRNIKVKNDLIDIRRIASALPYCDVVFCDNKWKKIIKRLEIDKENKCVLFTGTNTDLDEFSKFLLGL